MSIKKLNEEIQKVLNEISYETARKVNRIRSNTLQNANDQFAQAREKLANTAKGKYSVDLQSNGRERAEKDFKQAKDFQKLARYDYDRNQKLFEPKEKEYYKKANEKAEKFWELKDEYVEKLTDILEKDNWDHIQSEGLNTEYTYEKYIDKLNKNVYCNFIDADEFYEIRFQVDSPDEDDWFECCLSDFIELPNHPVYPEKMDHLCLDPRYDGPTAEDEWGQYERFIQNILKMLK